MFVTPFPARERPPFDENKAWDTSVAKIGSYLVRNKISEAI